MSLFSRRRNSASSVLSTASYYQAPPPLPKSYVIRPTVPDKRARPSIYPEVTDYRGTTVTPQPPKGTRPSQGTKTVITITEPTNSNTGRSAPISAGKKDSSAPDSTTTSTTTNVTTVSRGTSMQPSRATEPKPPSTQQPGSYPRPAYLASVPNSGSSGTHQPTPKDASSSSHPHQPAPRTTTSSKTDQQPLNKTTSSHMAPMLRTTPPLQEISNPEPEIPLGLLKQCRDSFRLTGIKHGKGGLRTAQRIEARKRLHLCVDDEHDKENIENHSEPSVSPRQNEAGTPPLSPRQRQLLYPLTAEQKRKRSLSVRLERILFAHPKEKKRDRKGSVVHSAQSPFSAVPSPASQPALTNEEIAEEEAQQEREKNEVEALKKHLAQKKMVRYYHENPEALFVGNTSPTHASSPRLAKPQNPEERRKQLREQYYGTDSHIIFAAAKNGDSSSIQKFVALDDDQRKLSAFYNIKDRRGRTPLHFCAKAGHTVSLDIMCSSLDHWRLMTLRNFSVFHYAALGGHLDTVEWFVEKADKEGRLEDQLFCRSIDDRTPLDLALDAGFTNIGRYLDRKMQPFRGKREEQERNRRVKYKQEVVEKQEQEEQWRKEKIVKLSERLLETRLTLRTQAEQEWESQWFTMRKVWRDEHGEEVALLRHQQYVRQARTARADALRKLEEMKQMEEEAKRLQEKQQEEDAAAAAKILRNVKQPNYRVTSSYSSSFSSPSSPSAPLYGSGGRSAGVDIEQKEGTRLTLGLQLADKVRFRILGDMEYSGIRIVGILPPAKNSGLQVGDWIKEANGVKLNNLAQFNDRIGCRLHEGESVDFSVQRDTHNNNNNINISNNTHCHSNNNTVYDDEDDQLLHFSVLPVRVSITPNPNFVVEWKSKGGSTRRRTLSPNSYSPLKKAMKNKTIGSTRQTPPPQSRTSPPNLCRRALFQQDDEEDEDEPRPTFGRKFISVVHPFTFFEAPQSKPVPTPAQQAA